MKNTRAFNEEVIYSADPIIEISRRDIQELVEKGCRNERKRIRICAHKNVEDALHEMLIVHTRETYVRPHKHLDKTESFHVIEGEVDVVVFDEEGKITRVIRMGDYPSGKTFYYRMAGPLYHTLLIRSDIVIFHETTNGPFRREDMVFAPWEPDENDPVAQKEFIEKVTREAADFPDAD